MNSEVQLKRALYPIAIIALLIIVLTWIVNGHITLVLQWFGQVDQWGRVDPQGKVEMLMIVSIAVLYLVGIILIGKSIYQRIQNGKKN